MLIDQQDGSHLPQNLTAQQIRQLQAMQQMYGAEDDQEQEEYGEEQEEMEGYGEEELMDDQQ